MREERRLYEFPSELLLSQTANPLSFHAAYNFVTICKMFLVAVLR